VDRFVERDDGDVQRRALDEVALDRIDARRVVARAAVLRRHLQPEHAVRVVAGRIVQRAWKHEQLPEFVLQRHASEEFVDAVLG